ncbi:MAG: hypothetical protein NTX50_16560, partial [Candidatus Sumerlaeota bacterium]|nr:hypothetical protein [Candidatus Sumerlaeota bacterium]
MKTSSRGKNSSSVVTLRVFGLNSEALMKTRERAVSGDPSLKPALDALVKDADKAIRKGPYSVIHKEKAGPSGDKHD